MAVPLWSQVDAGVAVALGAIVATAAVRKLRQPREFAGSLQDLDPALAGRDARALRLAVGICAYEAVVGVGVVAFRGGPGFVFACGLLVACAGFVLVLRRALQHAKPCACFGNTGRTAAGGREIARAITMLGGAGFVVVHRAVDASRGYGFGVVATAAAVATLLAIVVARRIGGAVRPGAVVRGPVTAE